MHSAASRSLHDSLATSYWQDHDPIMQCLGAVQNLEVPSFSSARGAAAAAINSLSQMLSHQLRSNHVAQSSDDCRSLPTTLLCPSTLLCPLALLSRHLSTRYDVIISMLLHCSSRLLSSGCYYAEQHYQSYACNTGAHSPP